MICYNTDYIKLKRVKVKGFEDFNLSIGETLYLVLHCFLRRQKYL